MNDIAVMLEIVAMDLVEDSNYTPIPPLPEVDPAPPAGEACVAAAATEPVGPAASGACRRYHPRQAVVNSHDRNRRRHQGGGLPGQVASRARPAHMNVRDLAATSPWRRNHNVGDADASGDDTPDGEARQTDGQEEEETDDTNLMQQQTSPEDSPHHGCQVGRLQQNEANMLVRELANNIGNDNELQNDIVKAMGRGLRSRFPGIRDIARKFLSVICCRKQKLLCGKSPQWWGKLWTKVGRLVRQAGKTMARTPSRIHVEGDENSHMQVHKTMVAAMKIGTGLRACCKSIWACSELQEVDREPGQAAAVGCLPAFLRIEYANFDL